MTVEAALNKLVEIDPRYQWAVRDGVIVMRPVEAWSNPNNPLNQVIDGFSMQDRNYRGALDLFRTRVFGEPPSGKPDPEVGRGQQVRRKFSMTTPAGPAIDALDSIARAHGALTWYVQYKTAPASVDGMVIWLYTFDDAGTLTSRHTFALAVIPSRVSAHGTPKGALRLAQAHLSMLIPESLIPDPSPVSG